MSTDASVAEEQPSAPPPEEVPSDDVLVFEDYEDDDPPLHADEVHKNFQVELQPPDRPDALYLFTLVDVDDELEPMGEVRTGYLFPDGRIDGLY